MRWAKHRCSLGVECDSELDTSVSVTYAPARSIPTLKCRRDVISWKVLEKGMLHVSPTEPFITDFTAISQSLIVAAM